MSDYDIVECAKNVFVHTEQHLCKLFLDVNTTFQQTITRFCIAWLKTCADDGYKTDKNNKESHLVAKLLINGKSDEELSTPWHFNG